MKIKFIASCPVCGKRLEGKLTVDRTYSTLGFEVDEMDDSCDYHIEKMMKEEAAEAHREAVAEGRAEEEKITDLGSDDNDIPLEEEIELPDDLPTE